MKTFLLHIVAAGKHLGNVRNNADAFFLMRMRMAMAITLILAGTVPVHARTKRVESSGQALRTAKQLDRKPATDGFDTSQLCNNLYFAGYFAYGNREWQIAFDSLTEFIDSCPNNPNAPHAFSQISSAVAGLYGLSGGSYRSTFLNWLESVLYLNTTNPEYFCADVEIMAGAMPLPTDTSSGWQSRATNIPLAVLRWLIQNTTCDTPTLAQDYDHTRQDQIMEWYNNTNLYKLDTTLPPLDSIQPGLKELLEKHFLYAGVSERPSNEPVILSNVSAAPNPLNTGTVISFTMGKEAYVRITLFDVMGKQLGTSAFESLFQPGNKSVPISLAGLPAGTYYARLQTAYGEVQTVKLVKE